MVKRIKYRTMLLFGMPGSGKGTQGAILGQIPGLIHVSCGDIFRRLSKDGDLGREVVEYTSQGRLVPDELTVRIWRRHIHILELQDVFNPERHTLLLDGLPRNYSQAERLDDILDVIQIFDLRIDDVEIAKERLTARALKENRLDDTKEEVILRRIKIFHQETSETLRFYPKSLICTIDAAQTPIEVLRDIVNRMIEVKALDRPVCRMEVAEEEEEAAATFGRF
jgi:adenylate kinase